MVKIIFTRIRDLLETWATLTVKLRLDMFGYGQLSCLLLVYHYYFNKSCGFSAVLFSSSSRIKTLEVPIRIFLASFDMLSAVILHLIQQHHLPPLTNRLTPFTYYIYQRILTPFASSNNTLATFKIFRPATWQQRCQKNFVGLLIFSTSTSFIIRPKLLSRDTSLM